VATIALSAAKRLHSARGPIVLENVTKARTAESDGGATLLIDNDRELFAARVDPMTAAQVGHQLRLALDPSRLYYFSPETGESLLADRH
jgi:hypothetical protein